MLFRTSAAEGLWEARGVINHSTNSAYEEESAEHEVIVSVVLVNQN